MNSLLSKWISNTYLKVSMTFSKLRFSEFNEFINRSDLRSSNSCRYHWILKFSVASYKSNVWEQIYVWLFYYFNFERSYKVFKSNSPWILLNKNINFCKNEMESKMENTTHSFRETNLVLQLIWESQIKSKTRMSWSSLFLFVQRESLCFWFVFYLDV